MKVTTNSGLDGFFQMLNECIEYLMKHHGDRFRGLYTRLKGIVFDLTHEEAVGIGLKLFALTCSSLCFRSKLMLFMLQNY